MAAAFPLLLLRCGRRSRQLPCFCSSSSSSAVFYGPKRSLLPVYVSTSAAFPSSSAATSGRSFASSTPAAAAAAAAAPPPSLPPPPPPPPPFSGSDGPITTTATTTPARTFCSRSCLSASLRAFWGIESETPGGFSELEESCRSHGERFPRIAARLFARKLLAAALEEEETGGGRGKQEGAAKAATAAKTIKDAREAEEALSALCFARVSAPYPPSWVETHGAFVQGLERWARGKEEGEEEKRRRDDRAATAKTTSSSPSSSPPSSTLSSTLSSLVSRTVPLDAWAACLARIHLNAFRVDAVWPATTREELMASMLSSMLGGSGGGGGGAGRSKGSFSSSSSAAASNSPSAEGQEGDSGEQAGTAVYAAASLANHSCCPSARPSFPRADATLALVATRNLSENDEVTVSYVDESLSLKQRRASLEFGYGFFCRCERCLAEEAGEKEEVEEKGGRGGG